MPKIIYRKIEHFFWLFKCNFYQRNSEIKQYKSKTTDCKKVQNKIKHIGFSWGVVVVTQHQTYIKKTFCFTLFCTFPEHKLTASIDMKTNSYNPSHPNQLTMWREKMRWSQNWIKTVFMCIKELIRQLRSKKPLVSDSFNFYNYVVWVLLIS